MKHGARIVLLGTGAGITPKRGRASAGAVVCVNDKAYLVECSSGIAMRLINEGIPLSALRGIFVTHHHIDHVADAGLIGLQSWSQLENELHIFGPPPIEKTVLDTMEIHRQEIEERMTNESRPGIREIINVHEITESTTVFEDNSICVRSCAVNHPPVTAYAYRFDMAQVSIVFSGDTTFCPALVDFAKGADVLVHEAFDEIAIGRAFANYRAGDLINRIKRSHSTVEDASRVASLAKVKTLILSPLAPAQGVPNEAWMQSAAKGFDGEILVGYDGLSLDFELNKETIQCHA